MRLRRYGITIVGWLLVLLGVAALVLPGPGLLLLLLGLVVLSQEYDWAERRVDPVKEKAFDVARQGVSTVPRIILSALGACAVVAVGVTWGMDPDIPTIGPLGSKLPVGGWATGSSIILSGLIALGLLIYSIKRFRPEAAAAARSAA